MDSPVRAQSLSISAGKLFLLVWTGKHSLRQTLCGSSFGLRASSRWMASHVSLSLHSAMGLGPHPASPEKLSPPEATRFNEENSSTGQSSCWIFPKNLLTHSDFFFFCFDNDLIINFHLTRNISCFYVLLILKILPWKPIICLSKIKKIYLFHFPKQILSAFWQGWDSYMQFLSCCVKNNVLGKITWRKEGTFISSAEDARGGSGSWGDTEWMPFRVPILKVFHSSGSKREWRMMTWDRII